MKIKSTGELKDDKPKLNDPCPKCGGTVGWLGPTYHKAEKGVVVNRSHPSRVKRTTVSIPEVLVWACKVCGYTRTQPTKDSVSND